MITRAQAVKLAVRALRREAKRLAVDANLHALYGAQTPTARNAHRERERLLEAARVLEASP